MNNKFYVIYNRDIFGVVAVADEEHLQPILEELKNKSGIENEEEFQHNYDYEEIELNKINLDCCRYLFF